MAEQRERIAAESGACGMKWTVRSQKETAKTDTKITFNYGATIMFSSNMLFGDDLSNAEILLVVILPIGNGD